MSDFPLDSATLILLRAACGINEDTGRTHLQDFLSMGCRETRRILIDDEGGVPVYEVEYEDGYEPFSEQHAISALVDEILRFRGAA